MARYDIRQYKASGAALQLLAFTHGALLFAAPTQVLCIRTFKTEEEGLEMANNSDYGLGRRHGDTRLTLPNCVPTTSHAHVVPIHSCCRLYCRQGPHAARDARPGSGHRVEQLQPALLLPDALVKLLCLLACVLACTHHVTRLLAAVSGVA